MVGDEPKKRETETKLLFFDFLYLLSAGSSLLRGLFSSCSEQGLPSGCRALASRRGGFSCCGAQALGPMCFGGCGTWAQ